MTSNDEHASDLLRKIMLEHASGSRKEIQDAFVAAALEADCLREIIQYWFLNNFHKWTVVEPGPHSRAVLAKERSARRQKNRTVVAMLRNQIKAALLMDLVLSNGKRVREATFGEMGTEGGWFLAVARCGRSNEIVGHKLTEADLVAIRERSNSRAYVA